MTTARAHNIVIAISGGPPATRVRAFVTTGHTIPAPLMDLPDLLEPERIRCRCDILSKKRALQTVAELLGASLRAAASATHAGEASPGEVTATTPSGDAGADADRRDTDPTGEGASSAAKERVRRAERDGRNGGTDGGTPDISDMDILDALISRERLGSTGLGHGVALPHSRLDIVDVPIAALITLNDGVDFESIDGEPVDIVLGLLVPRDCNDEHLEILANLARRFSDEKLREGLREAPDETALLDELKRLVAGGPSR